MQDLTIIQRIIIWLLPVIFAITVHEVAHGWVAKKLGDNTADLLGRLSFNPIRHIDPIGTLLIPALLLLTGTGFIFGWAKAVPVDGRNFNKPLQDMALVAVAGPASNLFMALAWAVLARIGVIANIEFISLPLIYMGMAGISINLVLCLLNLLPIPPLDGSRILTGILPIRLAGQYNQLERYGFFILLALLYTGVLNVILEYPIYYTQQWFFTIAGL